MEEPARSSDRTTGAERRVRAHLRVAGRVQGVAFRASAAAEARRSRLNGWVRNVRDGTVEAVAEGPRPAVEAFIAWCRHGPSGARVEAVEVAWGTPTGEHRGFEVRPDAGT